MAEKDYFDVDYTTLSDDELNRENLTSNFKFLNDASQFLAERNDLYLTDANEIYDAYLEHFRGQNVNEVTAVKDMYQAQNYKRDGDDAGLKRMGDLMNTFDRQGSEFNLETIKDYLGGVFTAPSTYAGMFSFGAAKGGALAAQQGIKFGIKELIKDGAQTEGLKKGITTAVADKASEVSRLRALRQGFQKGGYKTAIGAGVVDGLGASGTALAQEQTRVDLELKDDINYDMVALSGALGMAPGALLGGLTGSKKAITANTAEQYAIKELNKKRDLVNDAFKNKAVKNLRDKGFKGKTTTALMTKLKKSLAETAGSYNLNVGKRLKIDLASEADTLLGLDNKIIANVASAGAEIVDMIGPRLGVVKGSKEDFEERITSRIARGLMSSDEATTKKLMDSFLGVLESHNLSPSEFGALYLAEISQAGRTLGTQGRISKEFSKKLFSELNDLDKALFTLGANTEAARKAVYDKIDRGSFLNATSNFFQTLNKTRIGLMTIQAATTVRNTTNGYLRNYVYAMNNIGAGIYNIARGDLKQRFGDAELKNAGKFAAKEGVAQLQTGVKSLFLKDMVFGLQSEDTAILVRMFKDPRLGNSPKAHQLFRSLGDIGNVLGNDHSRMMKTARFFNTFNTMSDDLFKSAVFSREIDKMIRADIALDKDGKTVIDAGFKAAGINNLSDLVKTNNFKMVDDMSIAKAMNQAMDFTYQTGNFRGREGGFNKLAASFIDVSSSQLGSTFVPFPRYMVNAFRFFYEHAPILGMFNIGGVLNKSDSADRFAKQVTGLSMIAAFFGMRDNLGDENTGAFVYKNPYGHGSFDARAALGPFSAFAVIADYLYSVGKPNGKLDREYGFSLHDNDRVSEGVKIRDLVSALTGGGFGRAGISLDLVDGMVEIATKEASLTNLTRAEEAMARFVGNYFSTYTVGAGVIKDAVAMVDPDYRLLTDNSDVEFFPYVFKQATRSFPMEAHADGDGFFERPAQTSPYKPTGIRNTLPLFRQITGLTPIEEKNETQKELDRLKIDYVEVAPRKLQDPEANRDARQFVGLAVEKYLADYINSPEYLGLETDTQKRRNLKKELNSIRTEAIAYALGEKEWDTPEDILRKTKARFFRLPSVERTIIEEKWNQLNPDQEIDIYDYQDLLEIGQAFGFVK